MDLEPMGKHQKSQAKTVLVLFIFEMLILALIILIWGR